ncbi:MAG: hypothetical protein JWR37_979 [Mycobacterium sp.]|nr:hypothetical protein [Mycobacterium sp.]
MDSPSAGFRRAAAASWALVGIGIAGVAGASALAYADTVKEQSTDATLDVTSAGGTGEQGSPPATLTAPAPAVAGPSSTVQRHSPLTPTTSMAPNYSPGLMPGSGSSHTRSRGS